MRPRNIVLVTLLTLGGAMTACRSGAGNGRDMVWTNPEANAALQPGLFVRGEYDRMICPCAPAYYVFRGQRSRVDSFEELRTVLRPIDSKERALAYRKLLRQVTFQEGHPVFAQTGVRGDIQFHEGDKAYWGVYVASDAERWKVGHEPLIEEVGEAVVITQPAFVQEYGYAADGLTLEIGVARVELVREVFHRDGRYERVAVRVLETGEAAEIHQPAPLM